MKTSDKTTGTTKARKPATTTKSKTADVHAEQKEETTPKRTTTKRPEAAERTVVDSSSVETTTRAVEKEIQAPLPCEALSVQQIAERAFQLWLQGGATHGHHEEDWLRAEDQLKREKLAK